MDRPLTWTLISLVLMLGCPTTDEPTDDDDTVADDDSAGPGDDDSAWDPPPVAVISADVQSGPLPLAVAFASEGSEAELGLASFSWDFGDGTTAEGETATHTYLGSGAFDATLTVTDTVGAQASASLAIDVQVGVCPATDTPEETGTVASELVTEVSGVVDSRKNPGVLWVHNDSGDEPQLYALTPEGTHLGVYRVKDAPLGDWEDMAILQDPTTGQHLLVVGDIGDNQHNRENIRVHLAEEPDVAVDQEPVEQSIAAISLFLEYPGDEAFDSETLLVDPVTADIYVVTKRVGDRCSVYRKAAPHVAGETVEMELVTELVQKKNAAFGITTGGEFSPLGDRILIRGYGPSGRMYLRDASLSVADAFAQEPCEVILPVEGQAESVCFDVAGTGVWSIPEGNASTISYAPFVAE